MFLSRVPYKWSCAHLVIFATRHLVLGRQKLVRSRRADGDFSAAYRLPPAAETSQLKPSSLLVLRCNVIQVQSRDNSAPLFERLPSVFQGPFLRCLPQPEEAWPGPPPGPLPSQIAKTYRRPHSSLEKYYSVNCGFPREAKAIPLSATTRDNGVSIVGGAGLHQPPWGPCRSRGAHSLVRDDA